MLILKYQELRKGLQVMIRTLKITVTCIIAAGAMLANSQAQSLSLNAPAAWATLRTDSIIAKAQVDTASLKKKLIKYTVTSVVNGVSKIVGKKEVKVSDVSSDAFLVKLNIPVLGGTDYLKIEWAADSQKGEILPFGVADLNKLPKITPVQAKQVDDAVTLKGVAEGVKDEQFNSCGTNKFALVWNSKALFYVIKKTADTSTLLFGLDGKNAKNAFVSYPDRFIGCKKDSVWGTHFSRALENITLKYSTQKWDNEITKEVVGDKIVIKMPWYDTGIVPFDQRAIGFAAFVIEKEKVISSNPEKVQEFIPGTWGNLVLAK
jgi:hypothetical protein